MNATRELELMQWACADVINKCKAQPNGVTTEQLGLSAERVEKRKEDDNQSVRSFASNAHTEGPTLLQMLAANKPEDLGAETQTQRNVAIPPKDPWADMPSLIPNVQADMMRANCIEQLEMALAALKIRATNKPMYRSSK